MNKITGRELDPNQFPAWAEFTPSGESLTKVSAREGFQLETLIDQNGTPTMARVGAGIIESGYVSGRGWYVKYGDGTLHCFGRVASYNALTTGVGGWKVITMATPAYSKAPGKTSVAIACQGWVGASAEFTDEQPSYADIAVFNRGAYSLDTAIFFDFWGRWKA